MGIQAIESHAQIVTELVDTLLPAITKIGEFLAAVLAKGGTVYWCGNGGSAADSQHLAAELVGRFSVDRHPLRSVALTTDSSVLTCIANDFGYDEVFARQAKALLGPDDALVAISTSGESQNVASALQAANQNGAGTVALLGKGGGLARSVADHVLIIDSDSTSRIQEVHILIGHVWCAIIERELGLD